MTDNKTDLISKIITDLKNFLPHEGDFTIKLRNFIRDKEKIYLFQEIKEILTKIIIKEELEIDIRFCAYYALSIHYRRNEDAIEFCSLVDKYNHIFLNKYPLSYVNLSLHYKFKYLYLSSKNAIYLNQATENAKIAMKKITTNPGVFVTYVELVVISLENSIRISNEEINEAIEAIEIAIGLKGDCGKYYNLKGRLLHAKGEFKEATKLLEIAINKERIGNDPDSIIRTTEYYYHLVSIKQKEIEKKMNEDSNNHKEKIQQADVKMETLVKDFEKEIKEDLERSKFRYIEILAFFASIMAFIIGSIQMGGSEAKTPFIEKAALLLVLSGSLTLSFSLFRLLISHNNEKSYSAITILVFTISIFVIVLGLVLPLLNSLI